MSYRVDKYIVVLAIFFAFVASVALAEDWVSSDGVTYRNVAVLAHDGLTVTITFDNGGATLPLEGFSPEIQKRFGFDAGAAAALKAKKAAEEALIEQQAADKIEKRRQLEEAREAAALKLEREAQAARNAAVQEEQKKRKRRRPPRS